MAPKSHAQWSRYVNPPTDLTGEQDECAGQRPVRGFNAKSNEAPTKALTPPEAPTLPLIPSFTRDFFTKFRKVFIKTTQAQAQALAKPEE